MRQTWRDFLRTAQSDGVTLDVIETGEVDDEGHAERIQYLVRQVSGRPLAVRFDVADLDEPIQRRQFRRIMNALALPPTKYLPFEEN